MPDTVKLTSNQKQAVTTLDRSVSVSAGAGSGKTRALVERFCHIVIQGKAAVDEILTVTFTEKAAKEMKERIVRRFTSMGREDDRRAVESAYIGTIHGFCSRTLRENAFEAAVDPRYAILTEAEQRAIANQVLDSLFEARQADAVAMSFLLEMGTDLVQDSILSVYGHIRSLGWAPSAELIARANDPAPFWETFERCVEELLEMVESPSEALARVIDDISGGLGKVRAAAERLMSLQDDQAFNWADFQHLKEYYGLFSAASGPREVKDQIKATREMLGEFLAASLDRVSQRYSRLLLELTAEFHAGYTARKTQLGLLDYNDLLLETRDLFRGRDGRPTEVAERYREKLKFIILDEFQDTNRLQKEIIDAISRPHNVFTVGDVKQSIFSFIYSDVEVFREHHEKARMDRRKLAIPFQENFRSRKGVIDFANWFFGMVWGEDPDFDFEELKCKGRFMPKPAPDVEVILVPRASGNAPDRGSIEQGRRNEARAIAQRILELTGRVGDTPLTHTKEDRAGEPIRLGDIVILLRSTTQLHIYERTLEEYGIDTYAVSGRGFYGTREVQDVVYLLRAVDNPLNDVAMAAVLRSPFAGISEDALFWLARDWSPKNREKSAKTPAGRVPPLYERPGKLWRGLAEFDKIPYLADSDRKKLSDFHAMMRDLLAIRSQPRVTDMLDLALERSGFDVRLLAMRGGRRRYANIRKLYELAQEFQAEVRHRFGLAEFVAHVQELERLAEREVEAAVESEEGDVVRIMTIHKAKGLEAPVVFAADLSRGLGSNPGSFVFDPEHGLAVQIRNPLTYDLESPLSHQEISKALQDRAMSEEKRLLYVAMTRAEEHLVLVGCSDLKRAYRSTYRETNNWSGWIEKALSLSAASAQGELSRNGFRIFFTRGVPAEPKPSPHPEMPPLVQRFPSEFEEGRPLQVADVSPERVAQIQEVLRRCQGEEVAAARGIRRLAVSGILDYLECPAKYRLAWMIGAPEEAADRPEQELEEDLGFQAADLGHAVHNTLALVDFSRPAEAQFLRLSAAIEDERLRAEAWPALERFSRTPWCRELRSSDHVLQETPFELIVEGRVLAGRIDVFYRSPDGWTVLDYKTGQAEDRERYELQVGIYAHAASRLIGEMPARAVLLLLSANEEWAQDTADGAVARRAAERVKEVAAAIEADRFDPKPGKSCEWCAFGDRCGKD